MKSKWMPVGQLVLDFDLYPRHEIDSHNCTRLRESLEAGNEFDPIVVDKASNRVTDGFHRVTVLRRYKGDDARIRVVQKDYPDEEAVFLDMINLNVRHGKALSSFDRTRIVLLAERLKIDAGKISEAMCLRLEKIEEIRRTRIGRSADGKKRIALKRNIRQLAGAPLTARQEEANRRSSGMNPTFYIHQLLNLVESDLIDRKDERVMGELRKLHKALEAYVCARV